MWIEIASASYLLGRFIYHRVTDKPDYMPRRAAGGDIKIPRTEAGTPVPLIFGRCRVEQPILVWGRALSLVGDTSARAELLYVLGIGMNDGRATTRVLDMWIGDTRLAHVYDTPTGPVDSNNKFTQTGNGGPEASIVCFGTLGYIETLNGNTSQVLANDASTTLNAPTYAGRKMLAIMPATEIAAYRGFACVFLHGFAGWPVSQTAEPAYSFEVSSVEDANSYPGVGIHARCGLDLNPCNALWDVLSAKLGKLGLSTSLLDTVSFGEAAIKLHSEGHGYSRCVDAATTGEEIISEILEQIDATLDQDPTDGLIKIRLVRADYVPADLPEINRDNCVRLENFAISNATGAPNRIRVVFTDRDDDYRDGSVVAGTMANAVGQDGIEREMVIRYPGVCTRTLAEDLCGRELGARSASVMKCTAIVDRSFFRTMRGDCVRLMWSRPDVSGVVFRVADVDRGSLEDGAIALDLISDHFYQYRGQTPQPVDYEVFDGPNLDLNL